MRIVPLLCRGLALLFVGVLAAPAAAAPFAYVTNQDDNTVSVIDTASNTVVATVPVGTRPYAAVPTPDNAFVYVANFGDNSVSVIDAHTHTVTATLANVCTNPIYVAAMPGGTQVWVACFNGGQLKRIDIATNTVVASVTGQSRPSSIAFNSSGTRAYVASNTGSTVRVIDTAANTQIASMATGFNTVDVFASPDGAHVYSTANGDKRIWDSILAGGSNFYALPTAPVNLVMSPDGTYIYTTVNGGLVWRIQVGRWDNMVSVSVGSGDSGIDINGDGSRLYVTNYSSNSVSVIDTATFSNIATIPVGRYPQTNGHFVAKGPPPATSLPGAPTDVVATAGNGQVSVVFVAPALTGGSTILGYTASCGTQSKTGTASPLLVTGLDNGVAVTCTVVARNSLGDGPASAPSGSVTPMAVLPGSPGGVTIAPSGSGQVSVTFTPPGYDGGAPVLGYKATCATSSVFGTGPPILVGGLANGAPVNCTVLATNVIGDGPASAVSNTVTPGVAPEAPAGVTAARGDRQLLVSFVPGDDGGFAVSNFQASCGPRTANGTQSPIIVTSLANGVAVTCTVTATNARGTSPPSVPSNSIAPATVADAPLIGLATRGNQQISVVFAPGASDGGTPVTLYRAVCGNRSDEGMASPLVVTGLTNGTSANCKVIAINAVGESLASAWSNSVTPATVPDPVRLPSIAANALNLSLNFLLPLGNGGSPILGYRASCGPRQATAAAPPFTIADLPEGVPVSCSVVAFNDVGDSSAVQTNTETPVTVPGAPTGVTVTRGDGEVSVAFLPPPHDGSSPITSYLAACDVASQAGTSSPIVVSGLPNGVPVSCIVFAFNAVGNGPPSAGSNSVTPAGVPGAPNLLTATGSDGAATLAFAAPASNNGAVISGYTASCSPGTHSVSGAQSPLSFSGLGNGTVYSCSVRASNEIGSGAASNALAVTPRAVADLAISNSNGRVYLQGGTSTSYLIEVSNSSAVAVSGARVRDSVAVEQQPSWICTGQGGASCPASGNGSIDTLVDLPAGASVSFLLSVTVPMLPELPASNSASVTAPNSIADPQSANDTATDGPDAVGIFRGTFDGATP